MPTLNLGRVRFNWKGEYDPNASYFEYDVVKDDGQSYVAIQNVADTDPGPNETGGEVFWEGVLLRGDDYNDARDQAVEAAQESTSSANTAGERATAAADAADAAISARNKAEDWAEKMDGEVEPGRRSARHWAEEAQSFGDPNLLMVTAEDTSDERQLQAWAAQVLATQQTANSYQSQIDTANSNAGTALQASQGNAQAIGDNQEAISNLNTRFINVTSTTFLKQDGSLPAWSADGTTLETATPLAFSLGDDVITLAAGTPITLPALTNGTDYYIYAADDSTLQAVPADDAAPTESRLVGGFHAFDAGDGIAERSLWDLNWRPKCNPRAMVLSPDNRVWADIYLMDVEYGLHGYSRLGQQIADDDDRPTMPEMYGGDGVATYGSMSWWVAVDLATAAGKRLPLYPEFTAFAYGVVERQAVGTDPGTTQHQAGHRSACGVEQATGVHWQWGANVAATGGSSWLNIAEGRGDVYASNLKAVRLGAYWSHGSYAGSRASYWNSAPSYSGAHTTARGVCDHVNLQAER